MVKTRKGRGVSTGGSAVRRQLLMLSQSMTQVHERLDNLVPATPQHNQNPQGIMNDDQLKTPENENGIANRIRVQIHSDGRRSVSSGESFHDTIAEVADNQTIAENERLKNENKRFAEQIKTWEVTTANLLGWIKTHIQEHQDMAEAIQMVESIPIPEEQLQIEGIKKQLNIPDRGITNWGNPIREYLAKNVALIDPTWWDPRHSTRINTPAAPRQTQMAVGRPGVQTQQRMQQIMAPEEIREQQTQVNQRFRVNQTQQQNQMMQPTLHDITGYRRNDLKMIAEKIKSMETFVRVNELRYDEKTQPKQWMKIITEICDEQN